MTPRARARGRRCRSGLALREPTRERLGLRRLGLQGLVARRLGRCGLRGRGLAGDRGLRLRRPGRWGLIRGELTGQTLTGGELVRPPLTGWELAGRERASCVLSAGLALLVGGRLRPARALLVAGGARSEQAARFGWLRGGRRRRR